MLISHLRDFDITLNFEIVFTPLRGNDPVTILDEKHVTVTSFPLKHRIEAFGFIFREKQADRNIRKEAIEQYQIPVARITAIKKGENFITEDGVVILNKEITIPAPEPMSYAYCSDTMYFSRLAAFVKNVDLLYHEATFDKSLTELALMTGHSTTLDAARVASDGNGKH
jgi:ribonuclease Z